MAWSRISSKVIAHPPDAEAACSRRCGNGKSRLGSLYRTWVTKESRSDHDPLQKGELRMGVCPTHTSVRKSELLVFYLAYVFLWRAGDRRRCLSARSYARRHSVRLSSGLAARHSWAMRMRWSAASRLISHWRLAHRATLSNCAMSMADPSETSGWLRWVWRGSWDHCSKRASSRGCAAK